ncbi:MAG: DUF1080 domain-containing protein [Fimbriimonadaceae bacterium]|nr:DUF1080 domain-containing protein [Fimbriimonadaceae bacterium]
MRTAGRSLLLLLTLVGPLAAQTVDELLAKLPAPDATAGQAVLADLTKLGAAAYDQLLGRLQPAGGADAAARLALNGLAFRVTRPGAEAERQVFAAALLRALAAQTDAVVRADLLAWLQLAGKDEAVPAIGKLLTDPALADPAARALLRIGGPAVAPAFLAALPGASERVQLTLLQGLGALRATAAVPALLSAAASPIADLRLTAWDALAEIGDPRAQAALAQAAASTAKYERARGLAAYLRLAERLGEERQSAPAAAIGREVWAAARQADPAVASRGLATLALVLGERALPELLDGLASPLPELRQAAANLLARLPGAAVTAKLLPLAKEGDPAVRATVLTLLGRRGDAAAAPVVLAACTDADPAVRRAALAVAATLATPDAVQALARGAATAPPADAKALLGLLKQLPAERVLPPCVALWPGAAPALQVVLLDLFGARGAVAQRPLVVAALTSPEALVRRAAAKALGGVSGPEHVPDLLQQYLAADEEGRAALLDTVTRALAKEADLERQAAPVQARYAGATAAQQVALLDIYAGLGGAKAIEQVAAATQSQDTAVAKAAGSILAEWRRSGALNIAEGRPAKADVAQEGNNSPDKAVDGNVADRTGSAWFGNQTPAHLVIDLGATVPVDTAKVWFYWDGRHYQYSVDLSTDGQTWQTVVDESKNSTPASAGGTLHHFDAVKARWLRLTVLKNSANQACHVVELQAFVAGTGPQPPAPPKPDEDGFTALFNGTDLSGWIGAVNGYEVQDGAIVCIPERGGKLLSERQYADFIFRFEFKLTPGANNGVGVRCPPEGDAAYNAMEIQVLDDTAEQYAKLQPYQYHGSVYGVAAARKGFQKPVGQWNSQEIKVVGRRVSVTLNGELVVDVDLDEAARPQTLDHKEHPGLANTKGHLAFLGHGTRVEFRNLRIKDLGGG